MSDYEAISPEDVQRYAEVRLNEEVEDEEDWKMERTKMFSTLVLNVFCLVILAVGAIYLRTSSQELSSRFMSLLEIVIGAIFGVTATQISRD